MKLALGQCCFLATHGGVGAAISPEQWKGQNWQGLTPSLGIWPSTAPDCVSQSERERETANHFLPPWGFLSVCVQFKIHQPPSRFYSISRGHSKEPLPVCNLVGKLKFLSFGILALRLLKIK